MASNLFSALLYQFITLCGILTLMSYWSSGRARATGLQFMLLGMAVPVAAWGLTFFVPYASLAMPISLGILYLRLRGRDAEEQSGAQALADEDLADAERQIEADPKNAAAVFSKAQALEKRGAHALALAYYEEAHSLSDRMIPESELADIRDRLERAKDAAAGDAPKPKELGAMLETAGLAIGALLVLWNWLLGLNLFCLMLFLRWFRGSQRAERA